MKIIKLSICLLIYDFQDLVVWYENEKEVGTASLDFCKETGTPRLAIFHTTKLKWLWVTLIFIWFTSDRRFGMQSDYPCLLIGCYSSCMSRYQSKDFMHATEIYSTRRIPFMFRPELVVFSKKVHHIIGSMCMWFRQSSSILVIYWRPGRRWYGDFGSTIVSSSFSTMDITKYLTKYRFDIRYRRYSHLYSLIYKFAWFLLSGPVQIGLKAENCWKCSDFFIFQLSEDVSENLNER